MQETSSEAGDGERRPVPQPNLSSAQERWVTTPCGEPQASESICHETEIQDGRSEVNQGSAQKRRLDGHNRPEGCLPVSTSRHRASPVPEIHNYGQKRFTNSNVSHSD